MSDTLRMIDVVKRVHTEGDPVTTIDLDLDRIDDLEEAIAVLRDAQRHAAAAHIVANVAGARVAQLLGDGGAVRIGDDIWRYTHESVETCIDPVAVADLLTRMIIDGDLTVIDIVNPNSVKRGAISGAVRDTFFERTKRAEPQLSKTPIDRAPKFLQTLTDGETHTATV